MVVVTYVSQRITDCESYTKFLMLPNKTRISNIKNYIENYINSVLGRSSLFSQYWLWVIVNKSSMVVTFSTDVGSFQLNCKNYTKINRVILKKHYYCRTLWFSYEFHFWQRVHLGIDENKTKFERKIGVKKGFYPTRYDFFHTWRSMWMEKFLLFFTVANIASVKKSSVQ